jgi:hypothetical protein
VAGQSAQGSRAGSDSFHTGTSAGGVNGARRTPALHGLRIQEGCGGAAVPVRLTGLTRDPAPGGMMMQYLNRNGDLMRLTLFLFLAGTLFGQSSTGISAGTQPAPGWLITTDMPDIKVVIRLDSLPDAYRFEFWNNGDAPVLTKEQILQAIALMNDKTKENPEKVCVLGPHGQILNYPCRVKQTLTAARRKQ